jgi:hypothetical protein
MEDKTARLIAIASFLVAIASLVVAIAAAYISYTGSPYFYAQPHQMSYWTVESNSLTDEKLPKNGKLEVHVYNDSATPARNVQVVIRPLSNTPNITCDEGYSKQDGPDGTVLVTLERIPAKSTTKVVLIDVVDKYPNGMHFLGGPDYSYCGKVVEVQTDFGDIKKLYRNCKEYFSFLPDDKGAPKKD